MYPIIVKVGPVTIYSYGVVVAIGFITAAWLASRQAAKAGSSAEGLLDIALICIIFGILGARLLHVLLNFRYYISSPMEIIMLNRGGLAFQGGFFSALAAGVIYAKRAGLSPLRVGDILAPYLALGQAIGRMGCFLNGCCYGTFTESYFGFLFPGQMFTRHPLQLYYTISLLAIFLALRSAGKYKHHTGSIFLLYCVSYGLLRFVLDFMRGDLSVAMLGLTVSQSIGALIVLASLLAALIMERGRRT